MKNLNPSLFFVRLLVLMTICCLIPAVLMSGPVCFEQEKPGADLEKKYAPILGDYEFDLADMGGDVQTLNFSIIEGALWVDSGDGDPAECEPVEGLDFEFTAVSSDGQEFEIRFEKDDEGEFSICYINIVAMSIEIVGSKIK